jgi:hypothetical protein
LIADCSETNLASHITAANIGDVAGMQSFAS